MNMSATSLQVLIWNFIDARPRLYLLDAVLGFHAKRHTSSDHSKHVQRAPMKGDARATKLASPTPTNILQITRNQNAAQHEDY